MYEYSLYWILLDVTKEGRNGKDNMLLAFLFLNEQFRLLALSPPFPILLNALHLKHTEECRWIKSHNNSSNTTTRRSVRTVKGWSVCTNRIRFWRFGGVVTFPDLFDLWCPDIATRYYFFEPAADSTDPGNSVEVV